jgi:hypothetical protein
MKFTQKKCNSRLPKRKSAKALVMRISVYCIFEKLENFH